MSQHGAKHIARLEQRALSLQARIDSAQIKNLDDEKAELQSIRWVIKEIERCSTCMNGQNGK